MVRKLLLSLVVLTCGAFGQAVRYDSIAQVLTANNLYTPVSNGTVVVYNYPGATTKCATAGTCTLATTYIDETMITSCGTSVPLTRPTFNSCTGSTDAGANFGFWIKPGQYQYCISGTGVETSCNNITVGQTTSIVVTNCSGAGISSAISVLPNGGVIDAKGCIGSFTGGAWTSTVPVILYLGASSWAMSSNTITLANGSKIIGLGHQATTLTWTGDVDGITTPTGTTGGNVTVQGLSLVSGGLASASHAVVHLIDCPYCHVDDVFVNFDSSAASAGIRVEAVTANSGYGTWSGTISQSTVQRSANQGTRATSGQIDIDFKGNSGVTNGNISRWTLWGNHLEGGTINFQIFCGTANHLTGGDMFSGAPSVNITGNGPCNSNANYIATELNGVSIAGSKAFAIDAFSNFNTIAGDISQNLVAPTDAGSDNLKWYSTNVLGAGVYSLGSKTFAQITASGTATVDLASVASGACTADSADVTLTGAAVGDEVRVTAATALPAGVRLIGRVTASNTGRFQLCNWSGGAVDRASDTYTLSVVK